MENSKIEWTDHTFNPWWGCMKVSEGCKNCYAQTLDNRWNGGHWGPGSDRKPMSEAYWKKPLQWDKAAAKAGVKAKVFCASMADVFEDRSELDEWRTRLFNLIDITPNLNWLLLTKRPENIIPFTPVWGRLGWPDNVWIGTSVENQAAADTRIPHLLKVPAKVRFLSCEPLLGPVNLGLFGTVSQDITPSYRPVHSMIHWVIAGGESGHHARPMHPDWVRSLRYQCHAAGLPFFFKQWGEWVLYRHGTTFGNIGIFEGRDFKKGNYVENGKYTYMCHVGKKQAGAFLDGKEWKEFPE